MYASGARAQEICDLKVRDFFVEKNLYKLTITGKGNKTRRIVIAKPSGILLKRYLEETGRAGQLETYIFSSQTHPQMTISCVEEIYKKIYRPCKSRTSRNVSGKNAIPRIP